MQNTTAHITDHMVEIICYISACFTLFDQQVGFCAHEASKNEFA